MVQDVPILGYKAIILVFLVLCFKQMVMTDIFIKIFGIADGSLDGWKANIGTVDYFRDGGLLD